MWKADVAALASASALAAAEPLAAAVSRVAKILDADDAALREGCAASGWHALLVAKLYYEQPALLRWQLRDGGLLAACLPTEAEAALPPFEKALVGCLRDNPYEMLEAARAGWGDGWLLAHMWDLLWRARRLRVLAERTRVLVELCGITVATSGDSGAEIGEAVAPA